MLPKGCIHVTLPGAWKVARSLRIDYADACVRVYSFVDFLKFRLDFRFMEVVPYQQSME